MLDPRSALVYGLGAAVLALGATVMWQRSEIANERTAHANTKAQHAVVLQQYAETSATVAHKALQAQQALQALAGAIDTQRSQEKDNALANNEKLRAADSAPGRGLRIAAVCPSPARAADGVPGTAPSPRVDDGTVEIAPEVRRLIWDLRAEVVKTVKQLDGLQDREAQ